MSSKCNVLLFGATGLIGTYILKELIAAKPSFGQIGVFTSEKTVKEKADLIKSLQEQGIRVITGDLTNEEDVSKAYEGFNTIISALGRAALPLQIDLIKWAEQSSTIKHFVPSEYGTDIEYNQTTSPTEKPHQNKIKVRKYIREKTSKLDGFFLVTGPYVEGFISASKLGDKIGKFDVKNRVAVIVGHSEQRIAFSSMRDVGRFLVKELLMMMPLSEDQERGRMRYPAYKVCSFVTTPQGILDEFERQTGEKWTVKSVPLEEIRETETQWWDEGHPAATAATLRRIWAEGGTIYEKWDSERFGLERTDDLAGAVTEAIAAQMAA